MKNVIKSPFARMQKVTVLILCVVCTLLCWSCQNSEDVLLEPLSDEMISSNLSENGKIDPKLIIGEWEIKSFAYTKDGRKISNKKSVSNFIVGMPLINSITIEAPVKENLMSLCEYDTRFCMSEFSSILSFQFSYETYFYGLYENLMSLRGGINPFAIMRTFTDDGYDVRNALQNAYCFVIKGDELLIQLTGVENRNLLILKKSNF